MDASWAGLYDVVASNSLGAVTSIVATLAVGQIAFWGDGRFNQANVPLAATNPIALAAGSGHVLALRDDGTVVAWGSNACGQATVPASATNVVRLAAGATHSLALRSDGAVIGWGNDVAGQATPPADAADVVDLAAGLAHSLALRGDGTVLAWGLDFLGSTEVPAGLSNVTAIAAAGFHNLALRNDGSVAGWGQITNVPPQATNVVAIAAGLTFNAALRSDGQVVAWGAFIPPAGETFSLSCLGWSFRGGTLSDAPLPGVSTATNIVAIAAGDEHILALRADGTVLAWGDDTLGQIDVLALSGVTALAAGGSQSLALVGPASPRLWFWQTNFVTGDGGAIALAPAFAGAPPLSWSWQLNGAIVAGATNRFLCLPSFGPIAGASCVATVTNLVGAASALVFLSSTSTPPVITVPPAGQIVGAGSNVTFAVTASGSPPLAYQWQLNGANLTDGPLLSGSTAPILNLPGVGLSAAGSYAVIVSNALAAVTSSVATLQVLPDLPLPAALNTTGLVWTAGGSTPWVWETNNSYDSVSAAGNGPLTTLQTNWLQTVVTGPVALGFWWSFSGWPSDWFACQVDGVTVVMITGVWSQGWQSASVFVPPGSHTVQWVFACQVASSVASTAWLDQISLLAPVPVTITAPPTSQSLTAGANSTLSVGAAGTAPFAYQWQFNGTDLAWGTNASLTLTNVQLAQQGDYTVMVSNPVGPVTSQVATVTVNGAPPTIGSSPSPLTLAPGLTATFASAATGSEPLAYQWQRDRAALPEAATAALSLTNIQPGNAGAYRVLVNNAFGTAISDEVPLAVVPVAAWGSGAYGQTTVPSSLGGVAAISAGGAHSVALAPDGSLVGWGTYGVTGISTTPWLSMPQTNLVSLASAFDHDVGLLSDGSLTQWGALPYGLDAAPPGLTNLLAVAAGDCHNLALASDGSVFAWGLNADGQATVPLAASNVVAIAAGANHSLALRVDGTVLAWGANDFGQLAVPAGLSNVLALAAGCGYSLALRDDGTVEAWGLLALGGTNLPAGLSNVVALATGRDHALALRGDGTVVAWGLDAAADTVVPSGLGNVTAIACGAAHSLALVGDGRPVITVQPFRPTATNPRLNVRAVGAGSLAYQWQLNGVNLPGATSPTLQLAIPAPGAYAVTLSNALGTVTSRTVIIPRPSLRFTSPLAGPWLDRQGCHLRLAGLSGQGPVIIYSSPDLRSWQPVLTNAPVIGTLEMVDPGATGVGARFYRAVEVGGP